MKRILSIGLLALFALGLSLSDAQASSSFEISPAYAASLDSALSDWSGEPSSEIHSIPAAPPTMLESTEPQDGRDPIPLPKTSDGTITCHGADTCDGTDTCDGKNTCDGTISCNGADTCDGDTTCNGAQTCDGTSTCNGTDTCDGEITCNGVETCTGKSTCKNTCTGFDTCKQGCQIEIPDESLATEGDEDPSQPMDSTPFDLAAALGLLGSGLAGGRRLIALA